MGIRRIDEPAPVEVPQRLRFPGTVEDFVDFGDLVPAALRDRWQTVDQFVDAAVIDAFLEQLHQTALWRDANGLRPRDAPDLGRACRPTFRDEGSFRLTAAAWLRGRQ